MRIFSAVFSVFLLAVLSSTGHAADRDTRINSLLESAQALVAREALTPPTEEAALGGILKGYLQSVDAYSTYLTPDEVLKMSRVKEEGFVGVGMDVLQDSSGIIYCLPFPGSPAEKAGIHYGDILLSVDNVLVGAVPFLLLESLVRGEKGTEVRLGVTGRDGPRLSTVTRGTVAVPHVASYEDGPFPRVRIYRFTPDTPDFLREAVTRLGNPEFLVLDLRGNPGGDMDAALACASLFLDPENVLSILVNRKGEEDVRKSAGKAVFTMPVALWQDQYTASAAEVFIAALTRNGRSKSLGQSSFGKGVTQRAVGAGDGGIFILTTAKLLLPDRGSYHGTGLEPDLVVSKNADPEFSYFRRTYEAFGLRP